jgi:M6 family metalloprotease-like protein
MESFMARLPIPFLHRAKAASIALWLLLAGSTLHAAPFSRWFSYNQPDGVTIQLWGRGDEFQSVFETPDGYTAVFNSDTLSHQYARLSTDGESLLASGLDVGKGDPARIGLTKHLRIRPESAMRQLREKRMAWEQKTGLAQRWATMKAGTSAQKNNVAAAPTSAITGARIGIVIPICFKDSPADNEIKPTMEEIRGYYNGDMGSIKTFFLDNSNGLLNITHNVTTKWIRVSREKAYYDDRTKKYSVQGKLLIDEALDLLLKNPSEYGLSDMIRNVTTDGDGNIDSVSIIYYGVSQNIDDKALYPHQSSRDEPASLGSGKKIKNYAFTDCGKSFNLATMCHEIGHMVCNFPDLYRNSIVEGGDRLSGVGAFCIMGLGDEQSELTPTQFCAYLKYKAGWATAVKPSEPVTLDALRGSGTRYNQFLRFPRGGLESAKEYFLVENRNKSGWDQYLPGSGIVIYYVDEDGGNLEPKSVNGSTPRYECMVMEADGDFSLLSNVKEWGQANDFFFKGNSSSVYTNIFSDNSSPNSKWRDGTVSGLKITDFSEIGTSMTLRIASASNLAITGLNSVSKAAAPMSSSVSIASTAGGGHRFPRPGISLSLVSKASTAGNGGQHLRAGDPFNVTVISRDSLGDTVEVDTDTQIQLVLLAGTGQLGGSLTGIIKAGTASVTLLGVTYSKAEKGIILEVKTISGDNLAAGESDPFEEEAAPWLVITDVNGGISPIVGFPFGVTIQAQDSSEQPLAVASDTQVALTLSYGHGILAGTLVGTIVAGKHTVSISGITYSKVETDIELTATATSGDALSDGDSEPFSVMPNLYAAVIDRSLVAGGATTLSTSGIGESPRTGYAVATMTTGSAPYGVAVFSHQSSGVVVSEAAVPASPPIRSGRIFVDFRSNAPSAGGTLDINTGIALANPGTEAAQVSYTLRDRSGVSLAAGQGVVAAGSQYAKFINQLQEVASDFRVPADFSSSVGFGSLDISSDHPISLTALRQTVNQRNEALFTSTPVADLSNASGQAPLYFPQCADGGGYRTTLVLLNASAAPESGTLDLFNNSGAPMVLTSVSGASGSSFNYSIPPNGVYVFQTDGLPVAVSEGWVRVKPDNGSSSPVGAGVFSFSQEGILSTESGVPSAVPTTHARIYVDYSGNHSTGLAVANPESTGTSVTLQAYEMDGVTPAGDGPVSIMLNASEHKAGFVSQLISGLPDHFAGILDITSPTPLAALTLRALVNERGSFLLTTFPIADMLQPAPSPLIFPQIADGGGYRTEFILLNAEGASNVTFSLFGQDGLPMAIGN